MSNYDNRSIKIGNTDMTSKQLLENLEMAIPVIVDKIPRKWKNIQSLYIKTAESISLPIYNSLPNLPIEIDSKDIKRETYNSNDDNVEIINESENDDYENSMEEEDDDDDDDDDDETEEESHDENEKDNTDEEEDEEEIPIKKRKVSKDAVTSLVAPKNNKSSQVTFGI